MSSDTSYRVEMQRHDDTWFTIYRGHVATIGEANKMAKSRRKLNLAHHNPKMRLSNVRIVQCTVLEVLP